MTSSRACFTCVALLLCLALNDEWLAAQGNLPAPVLELRFDDGFANSGRAGGAATVTVYAEGEGPILAPGPWGDCLDLTAASRFGGTLEQLTPSGSAVVFAHPELNALSSFTVSLWARATTETPDIASRLLNKAGAWELTYANGRPSFLIVRGNDKLSYRFPDLSGAREGHWGFFALSVDRTHGKIHLYCGDRETGLTAPLTLDLAHAPPPSDGPLEVGNFSIAGKGIRPFKGWVDNVRIYDSALTAEQIGAVFAADLAVRPRSRCPIFTTFYKPPSSRRFQPRRSAIFFSSRWQARRKQETFDLLRAFHVTHLLWVYGANPDYIREVHALGVVYEGTLNGLAGTAKAAPGPSAEGDTTGRQRDLDGNKVILGHMARWKKPPFTGCQNNPDFRKIFWEEARQLVEAGVDSIMVDDWEMAANTAAAGISCFCPACIDGFRDYLRRKASPEELRQLGIADIASFNYREFLKTKLGIQNQAQYKAELWRLPLTADFLNFQREGVRDFYRQLRKYLNALSPKKYITLSCNCQFYWGTWDDSFCGYYCVDLFDFLDGEASKSMQTANDYVAPCKVAEAFGVPQVMQTKPRSIGQTYAIGPAKAALATSYALGQWFLVPWDLYMDNDAEGQPAPRYYGTVEEWGAFYDFIHDHPQLFEGYETTATVGVLFNADAAPRQAVREVSRRLMELQVPFRMIAAAARYNRLPLRADALKSVRCVIQVSPLETFCEEDRKTILAVRDSYRVRFLKPEDDLDRQLSPLGLKVIEVEGPKNIYAFLRVRPEPPSAVIHVVNWNVQPDGRTADAFSNVTLRLAEPDRWGASPKATYHRPGQKVGLNLTPEPHADFLRITLPRLETWGVVEITAHK